MRQAATICSLILSSLMGLDVLSSAQAATVTDTLQLTWTGNEWCQNDPKFSHTVRVTKTDLVLFSLTRDTVSGDIQATIDTHGGNATIDAIPLNGEAVVVNKTGSAAQLVLSGTDPGNPAHYLMLRGKATFDKTGKLTQVTGTFVFQILDTVNGVANSECFGSGTFATRALSGSPGGGGTGLPPFAQQAYLKASNTGASDFFGMGAIPSGTNAVAVSGDTIVVGAPQEDSNATGVNGNQGDDLSAGGSGPQSGAAYVFTRTGGVWSQQAYLKASNTGPGALFGSSVAISGDTLVVGAPYQGLVSVQDLLSGTPPQPSTGAVYVFTRTNGVWSQQAFLKGSNTEESDTFGTSVQISGDTLIAGAPTEDSSASGINGNQADNSLVDSGAAYVFTRTNGVWSQQAYLKASNTNAGDWFGQSVGVSGDTVIVGARFEASSATGVNGIQTDNSAAHAGAAYVFTRTNGVWSQQAYLKASNTNAVDEFGTSVAISGDTVVVGAPLEDSLATGVNGNQTDNSLLASGAAYVFTRANGVWSQQAYLKSSIHGGNSPLYLGGAFFGGSVGISGDTLLVGSNMESSNAQGVNGDQTNLDAIASGAAYVFTRTNSVWSQRAYLKASNTNEADEFGSSVAVDGNTLVIGAPSEASNATGVNGNQLDNSAAYSGAAYVFVGH